jgi:hypothetical protein
VSAASVRPHNVGFPLKQRKPLKRMGPWRAPSDGGVASAGGGRGYDGLLLGGGGGLRLETQVGLLEGIEVSQGVDGV